MVCSILEFSFSRQRGPNVSLQFVRGCLQIAFVPEHGDEVVRVEVRTLPAIGALEDRPLAAIDYGRAQTLCESGLPIRAPVVIGEVRDDESCRPKPHPQLVVDEPGGLPIRELAQLVTGRLRRGCHSHWDGESCANAIRVKRVQVEDVLLRGEESGLAALLAPARIERMAKEMQTYYSERVRVRQTRADEVPRELQELAARIERLRERLKRGDPDMTADELQAAIDRAESKRRELEAEQPEAKQSARVLSILPRAADLYRRQVAQGLDGDPRAALKARVFLRDWFSGKIRLEPLPDGGLVAHWDQNEAALLRAADHVVAGAGSC